MQENMDRSKIFFTLAFLLAACTSTPPAPKIETPKPAPATKQETEVEQNCSNPKLPEGETLQMSLNLLEGRFLQLSDNSVWKVNPDDVDIASSWLTPAEIEISKSENKDYPCKLSNQLTRSSIRARRLASLKDVK